MAQTSNNFAGVETDPLQARYTYQQLKEQDSIRLLRLKPRDLDTSKELRAELLEVQLGTDPEYEALSYAWGDAADVRILHTPSGSIEIRQNLADALQHLGLKDKERYIWADALCINQADDVERSSQVAIMGDIYRQANRVIVWLGLGNERTAEVFNLFRTLSSKSDQYGVDLSSIQNGEDPWHQQPKNETQSRLLDNIAVEYDFSGMDGFYTNTWFQRLWVVQEVALAREIQIHCGLEEIPWNQFVTTALIQFRSVRGSTLSNLRLPYGFEAAVTIITARSEFKKKQPIALISQMVSLWNSKCSMELDRIFAVLNLKGSLDPNIYPDYTKSVADVYISTSEALIRSQPHILSYAGVAPRLQAPRQRVDGDTEADDTSRIHKLCHDLPSWVADWRIYRQHPSFAWNARCIYTAALAVQPQGEITYPRRPSSHSTSVSASSSIPRSPRPVFTVKALMIDVIHAAFPISTLNSSLTSQHTRLLTIKSHYDTVYPAQIKPNTPVVSGNDDDITAWSRTILAAGDPIGVHEILRNPSLLTPSSLVSLWEQYASTPPGLLELTGRLGGHEKLEPKRDATNGEQLYAFSDLQAYRFALKRVGNDHAFFITANGFIGLGPDMIKEGDAVVLIAGLGVPVILRPTQREGGLSWYLIGDCYTHGVMHGEYLKLLQGGRLDQNWFAYELI